MSENRDLQAELDEADRRVRELRGARHAITRDLEWTLKEQDRLRRHLFASHEEERGD